MAGEVRIQTFVDLINFGGCSQFSVPNPALLVAAFQDQKQVFYAIN